MGCHNKRNDAGHLNLFVLIPGTIIYQEGRWLFKVNRSIGVNLKASSVGEVTVTKYVLDAEAVQVRPFGQDVVRNGKTLARDGVRISLILADIGVRVCREGLVLRDNDVATLECGHPTVHGAIL